MSLKIGDLGSSMLGAVKDSLASDWPKVRDYGKAEFKKLAQSLIDITKLAADGKVTASQARSLVRIHRNTTLMVMLTVEGMGIIAAEKAINAALRAVKDAVNAVSPFNFL